MVALQTFLNLSPERQEEILLTCLEEFAVHDYESASLSDIIKKLDLAKGSFYRYFESKKSLYMYLLQHCLETRLKHDHGIIQKKEEEDFFELYTRHFKARLQFEKKFPLHSGFLHALLRQKPVAGLEEVQQMARKKIVELLLPDLKEDIRNDKIRKDQDPELMAFLMSQIYALLADYAAYQRLEGKKWSDAETEKTGKHLIDLLKNGMSKI